MDLSESLCIGAAVLTTLVLVPQPVAADPPCPSVAPQVIHGELLPSGGTASFNIVSEEGLPVQPCEEVRVLFSLTTSPNWGASVGVAIRNAADQDLFFTVVSPYGSGSESVPQSSAWYASWFSSYPATKGIEGIPAKVVIHSNINDVFSYDITVVRHARPGYNLGSTGFSNAPLIQLGTEIKGNVLDTSIQPGQFWKIHLDPGQKIWLTGEATAPSTDMTIKLYDADEQFIQYMVGMTPGVHTPFPAPFPEFVNGPQAADYYLVATTRWWPVWDFRFVVQTPMPQEGCTYEIEPGVRTVGPVGGTIDFTVFTPQGCPWTAPSDSNFLHLISGGGGTGSGTVTYSVDNYTAFDQPRTASFDVATRTVNVTQQELTAGRWKNEVSGCYWEPFDAGPNQCDPSVGHWKVSSGSCRWQQGESGADECSSAPVCAVSLSTTDIQVQTSGESGTFSLSTDLGCAWALAPAASWLALSPSSGIGPATISYTIGSTSAARVAVVAVGGATVTFTQLGSSGVDATIGQSVAVPRIRLNCGTSDCDGDGLPDDVEDELANRFFPTVHHHHSECGIIWDTHDPAGLKEPVLYRARYLSVNGVIDTDHIAINYVMLYPRDCGPPGSPHSCVGVCWHTQHDGDNEPFVVFLVKDVSGTWQFESIAAVAHSRATFLGLPLEVQSQSILLNAANKPDLWVGYKKHGNFVQLEKCDGGYINQCVDPGVGLPWHLYNVGERLAQFIDDLSVVYSRFKGQRVWQCQPFMSAGIIRDDLYLDIYPSSVRGPWENGDIVPGTSTIVFGGPCS